MSEPKISVGAAHELVRESRRQIAAFASFVHRYPQFRKHAACAALGTVVALADSVGEDAEGVIANFRKNFHEKLPPIVPPSS